MKYVFSFQEVTRGSIAIEADHRPSEEEVENAIMEGSAFIKDTQYENIKLVEQVRGDVEKRRGGDAR